MRRRRTRRCSAAIALASRGASALQAWLCLLVFIFQNEFRISDSIQPGYLDFDNLPDTNFTCTGKVIGGYYADLETSCQMFHVCTVGQGDEPMDIKFLCLNGTVFDQETRVCERVDEVDCTKSEKFYSLNLELYGNTAAPAIEPEHETHDESHDQSHDQHHDQSHDQSEEHDNKQDNKSEPPPSSSTQPDPSPESPHKQHEHHTEHVDPVEDTMEDEEQDEDIDEEYEEYTRSTAPSTTQPASTTPQLPPPTTTTARPTTTQSPPVPSTSAALPTYGVPSDPTLLSPHEFTYQHRPAVAPVAPPPPALSFQRQSYPQHAQPPRLTLTAHRSPSSPQPPPRPADSVYITAAPTSPPHQFSELEQIDHYELYESSKNAPRRPHERPAPFLPSHASRIPQGFRPPATASPPRSQLPSPGQYEQRPVQSYQPSERHEIYEDRYRPPPPPPQPTFDYNRFHFDRKRSHETEPTETIEVKPPPLARSAYIKPTAAAGASSTVDAVTERPTPKFAQKSPPRVIVTASASVSDSNGKKLNYTVGNVVSAVKPIVPINYDDYKESDLIFDPFFLDVPKLKRRRKTSGGHGLGKRSAIITLTQTAAPLVAPPSSRTFERTTTPAAAWLPPDYVDDNYEPNSYVEAPPPAPVHRLDPIDRKEEEKQKDVKTEASEIVASSQTPATSSTAAAKPVQKKLAVKIPTALRPLLAVLPRPSRGEYHVVRAGPTSPGRYSCDGQRPYEVWADARDCRSFYVCTSNASSPEAAPALHVHLQCAPGLQYDKAARACALPARHQTTCHKPLDNV